MTISDKFMRFAYSANRLASFVLSAMMSFIFYASLAGSNQFFFWFNGIAGVVFDIKKVEMWDSGKKVIASFFIAFSVIAFAGSSLMETERNSIRKIDAEYVSQQESDIKTLESGIIEQQERVRNTPSGYGTAAEKEAGILERMRTEKDRKTDELQKYKQENVSDESMSSFEVISSVLHVDVVFITWFFFIFRGILLEVSVLATSSTNKKILEPIIKEKIVEKYVKPPIFVPPDGDTEEINSFLESWERQAQKDKKVNALKTIETLKRYHKSFDDYVKKITS